MAYPSETILTTTTIHPWLIPLKRFFTLSLTTILSKSSSSSSKNFDPSTINDLMKLFELESYKSWAAMELEHETEVAEAEDSIKEAEDYLESAMESAMEEFRRFEEEMEAESNKELQGLLSIGEAARERGDVEKKKILDLFETWTAAPSSSLFGIQQKQDLKNNFLFHQVWDSDGVSRRRDIVKR
ncbi:hypothetical protein LXL04_019022 [Taraxacum kok-saghyz]